jgi:hypothetical protein
VACLAAAEAGAFVQDQAPTSYLVGRISADGSRLMIENEEGEKAVELIITQQQAAEVPRRVDLRRFRGKHVIVICQPWHGSEDRAWGCEAIGRLAATKALPRR